MMAEWKLLSAPARRQLSTAISCHYYFPIHHLFHIALAIDRTNLMLARDIRI